MLYRSDKYGNQISQLGYGCMRFTKKGTSIDYEKAKAEVLHAIELGINYYDTAYIYTGVEDVLGRILEETGMRDKVYIATKLPQYTMRTPEAIDKTFKEELKRLRTDHIDYYLMHMFTDYAEWENLKKLGIEQWIADRKADGSIRQIGFSYHGDEETFIKILNAYDWEFCQVQYNYIDEHSQAGRGGVEAAGKKSVPVIIMEPLRGGKLINLPDKAKAALDGMSPAELGLSWLWDQPEISCVLSGMNSVEMAGHMVGSSLASTSDSSVRLLVWTVGDKKMLINERTPDKDGHVRWLWPGALALAGCDSMADILGYKSRNVNGSNVYRLYLDIGIASDVQMPDGSQVVRKERVSVPVLGKLQPMKDSSGRY